MYTYRYKKAIVGLEAR